MAGSFDVLVDRLIQRLHDRDPVVRFNAVGALRLHGTRAIEAMPEIFRLTGDDDPRVRAEARRTLDRLRQSAA